MNTVTGFLISKVILSDMEPPLLTIPTDYGDVEIVEYCQDQSFLIDTNPDEGFERLYGFPEMPVLLEEVEQGDTYRRFKTGSTDITIAIPDSNSWAAFYKLYREELISLLFRFSFNINREDFFWIATGQELFFHFELVWNDSKQCGQGRLACFPDESYLIDRAFYLQEKSKDYATIRMSHAQRIFDLLTADDGFQLSPDFPLLSSSRYADKDHDRTLVIKLPPDVWRYALLPFEGFRTARLGQFGGYKKFQYMVTDKPILKDYLERLQVKNEINDPEVFVRNTVIIINLYEHFKKDPALWRLCKKSVAILRSILGCFKNVDFNGRPATLRYYCCPKGNAILKELAREETRFVFGDFHTEDNRWLLSNEGGSADFYEQVCRLQLDHIRKMAIYHCNSGVSQQGKAGIVSNLLATGVWEVEGSNKKESFLLFTHTLISLFTNSILCNFIPDEALLQQAKDHLTELNKYL